MEKRFSSFKTVGELLVCGLCGTHLLNRYISEKAGTNNLVVPYNGHFYTSRLGSVFYRMKGDGKPILLIHNIMPGSSAMEWDLIFDQLSEDYKVYAIDLLGYGRSEKPNITYTSFAYVQLIQEFIKNVIKEKTFVVASRFSSSFVLMSALLYEDLYYDMVLINPPSIDQLSKKPSRRNTILKKMLELPVLGTMSYHMIVSRETIANTLINNMFYNPFDVNRKLIDTYYEAAHKNDMYSKNVLYSYFCKYLNSNIENAITKVKEPVFIIKGEEELQSNIDAQYIALNSNITEKEIMHTKKLPHMEKPQEFLNVLYSCIY